MIKCPKCNNDNYDDSNYCDNCGQQLEKIVQSKVDYYPIKIKMDESKKNELKWLYSEWSIEQLLDRLAEGKDSFEEDAFSLMCEEAKRRNLEIPKVVSTPKVEYIEREVVFCTSNIMEARMVKGLLESNDIKVFMVNDNVSKFHLLSVGIELSVAKDESVKALEIINEYRNGKTTNPSDGSNNPFP